MRVYLSHAPVRLAHDLGCHAAPLFTDEKRRRFERCTDAQSRACMALGEILLACAVQDSFGLDIAADERGLLEHGKPFFVGRQDVHFNISHSGEHVLVAVDRAPVGVDIERHRRADELLARRVLTPDEYAAWEASGRDAAFFSDTWVRKESFLKWRGDGLSGLDTVTTALPALPEGVSIVPLVAPAAYSAAVCGWVGAGVGVGAVGAGATDANACAAGAGTVDAVSDTGTVDAVGKGWVGAGVGDVGDVGDVVGDTVGTGATGADACVVVVGDAGAADADTDTDMDAASAAAADVAAYDVHAATTDAAGDDAATAIKRAGISPTCLQPIVIPPEQLLRRRGCGR